MSELYRVYLMAPVAVIDVEADDPERAVALALQDYDFGWRSDVLAEGDEPWQTKVKRLPETPKEDVDA